MSLFVELKRRNVFRVAAAYVVLSWLLLQLGDILFDALGLPEWSIKMLVALIVLGFVPVIVFSWAYELTPEGIKKESEVDRTQSITPQTGRKLEYVTIGLLLVALGLFLTEDLWRSGPDTVSRNTADGEGTVSVAVLPFANMSPDADNEYFADGISEEILNLLSDVEDLSVASRTSAFAFKGKDTPIPQIADALKVRYVLEGSVRKAGDQIRVTAQLIDAKTDRHLWSDTFDRTLEDIFAIQDEIAGAIGDALRIELLGSGGETVKAREIDPEVYARFLEARHKLRQRLPETMREANEMLIRIVEAEPGFARAHVVLGEAYLVNLGNVADPLVPDDVAESQARMHAEIARSLDPDLGGIDLILGSIARDNDDLVTALEHYARAQELEPTEPRPYHWRGMLYCSAGYLREGVTDLREAVRLDPQNPNAHFALADCLADAGAIDAATELARRGMQLGMPYGFRLLARLELLKGNRERAADIIVEGVEKTGMNPRFWAEMLEELGSNSDRITVAESESETRRDYPFFVAAGRIDEYLEHLEGADPDWALSEWSNRYREMRRDPRYIQYMERAGMTDLWRKLGPPPDCRAEGESFSCGHGSEKLKEGMAL